MSATEHINLWLNNYGRQMGTPLSLRQGVCALANHKQQQIAVVEVPGAGDAVVLHCSLGTLDESQSARHLRTLLALNFELDAMRGCWLALDGEEQLRLTLQFPVEALDENRFITLLQAFIQQSDEVKTFLKSLAQQAT